LIEAMRMLAYAWLELKEQKVLPERRQHSPDALRTRCRRGSLRLVDPVSHAAYVLLQFERHLVKETAE
jgi:hypothetical protein